MTSSRQPIAEAPFPARFAALGFRHPKAPRRPVADIPEAAISEKFLAGTGPGGQNVNKVATACQLRRVRSRPPARRLPPSQDARGKPDDGGRTRDSGAQLSKPAAPMRARS